MTDDDDDIPECDLGPWRDPSGDGEDDEPEDPSANDGSRRFVGVSFSALVNRWLAMPDHYDLRGFLASRGIKTISIDQPPESAATPTTAPTPTKETP